MRGVYNLFLGSNIFIRSRYYLCVVNAARDYVYSLGMVLHYLLVPFKKWWPAGVKEDEWIKHVSDNKGPPMPDAIRNNTHPYTHAMVKAIDLALEPDPIKRAGAREVANVLKKALSIEVGSKEND